MKRVLIITYYWPPSGGSGVQRWVKFAEYLPSEEWHPVIYTPENPELIAVDPSLAQEIPDDTEIIRRPIFEPYGLYRSITGRASGKGRGKDEVNPISAGKKTFMQKLALTVRGNLFIPDPRCFWIGPSARFLKKYLKAHPVDVIVSTGPPHSMHLIAMKVARATGIPWVADFRDPWTDMFYFKYLHLTRWAERRHRKLEQQVLDSASAIVAVSPLVRDDFMRMTSTPVELITNGYDEKDFEDAIIEPDGYFNITHTGLFAADGNPEVIWKALADKSREDPEFRRMLKIRLIGKTDNEITASIKEAGLAFCLIDNGYQPHNVAVKEQMNASVLILPLRKEPEYRATLPGKLFEYLAAGCPILGIGQPDGAMASVLKETGAGSVYDWNDLQSVAAFIDGCWKRFRSGALQTEERDISQYSRRRLTSRMAALFDSLAGYSAETTEKRKPENE